MAVVCGNENKKKKEKRLIGCSSNPMESIENHTHTPMQLTNVPQSSSRLSLADIRRVFFLSR
jgi:hypothetical protein